MCGDGDQGGGAGFARSDRPPREIPALRRKSRAPYSGAAIPAPERENRPLEHRSSSNAFAHVRGRVLKASKWLRPHCRQRPPGGNRTTAVLFAGSRQRPPTSGPDRTSNAPTDYPLPDRAQLVNVQTEQEAAWTALTATNAVQELARARRVRSFRRRRIRWRRRGE